MSEYPARHRIIFDEALALIRLRDGFTVSQIHKLLNLSLKEQMGYIDNKELMAALENLLKERLITVEDNVIMLVNKDVLSEK